MPPCLRAPQHRCSAKAGNLCMQQKMRSPGWIKWARPAPPDRADMVLLFGAVRAEAAPVTRRGEPERSDSSKVQQGPRDRSARA